MFSFQVGNGFGGSASRCGGSRQPAVVEVVSLMVAQEVVAGKGSIEEVAESSSLVVIMTPVIVVVVAQVLVAVL